MEGLRDMDLHITIEPRGDPRSVGETGEGGGGGGGGEVSLCLMWVPVAYLVTPGSEGGAVCVVSRVSAVFNALAGWLCRVLAQSSLLHLATLSSAF